MNRRGFFLRASAIIGGLFASCMTRPELVFGQSKEPRILDVLRDEVARARKTAPKDLTIAEPFAGEPYPFRFHVHLRRGERFYNLTLDIAPAATADDIRKQFRVEYTRALKALGYCTICETEAELIVHAAFNICGICKGIGSTLYPAERIQPRHGYHIRDLRQQGYLCVLSPKVAERWMVNAKTGALVTPP